MGVGKSYVSVRYALTSAPKASVCPSEGIRTEYMSPVHSAGEAAGEQLHQSFSLGKQALDLRTSFNRSLLTLLSLSLSPSLVMASERSCVYTPSRIRGSLQGIKMSAVLPRAGSLTSVVSSTQDEKPFSLNQRGSWIIGEGKKEDDKL